MAESLIVAEIVGAHGIRGWVKLKPWVEDPSTLLAFDAVDLVPGPRVRGDLPGRRVKVEQVQGQGKGVIARFAGVVDRNVAEAMRGFQLVVAASELPAADPGDYYWRDLVGLAVWCGADDSATEVMVGRVDYLLETGANDVLVVKASDDSIDDRERLIPWLPEDVVREVDLAAGRLRVRWHLDD